MTNLPRPSWQFFVFLVGGLLCAAIDIGVMQLLLRNGAAPTVAASAGFGAGLLLNYAFHTKVTFGRMASRHTFFRFLSVVLMNYLITIGMVALAHNLGLHPLVGKIASLPLVAINGFLLSKYWIFK